MINGLALGLLVTSLAAASVWSPPREKQQPTAKENLIRRVIVIEYETEGLLPTSPQQTLSATEKPLDIDGNTDDIEQFAEKATNGIVEKIREKYIEAASVIPNLGQGISTPAPKGPVQSSKEKICDAYGICKERISDMFGATKDKTVDKLSQVRDEAKEAGQKVVHGVETMVEDAKLAGEETAESVVDKVKRSGQDMAGKVKKASESAARTTGEKIQAAKETVEEIVKRTGEEVVGKAKGAARTVGDKIQAGKDIAVEVADKGKSTVEEVAEKAKRAGEGGAVITEEDFQVAVEKIREARRNLTEIIRRGRDMAYDAGMYAMTPETVRFLMEVIHLLGFSASYGTCVWVTFASSHVLARALPRQHLAIVQSKIYPVYFRAMAYGAGVSFLTHFFMHRWLLSRASNADMFEAHILLACLGLVLINLLYLERRATKAMFDSLKLEKEEGRGRDIADMVEPVAKTPTATVASATTTATAGSAGRGEQEAVKTRLVELNRRLKSLNTYSSSLNVAVLVGLTWHLVYLAQRLHVSC